MPIETKIAAVGNSYSALDFQADVVVCVNGGAKVYKLLDNIEIVAVDGNLLLHTWHDPTRRQHIFRFALDSTKRSGDISHHAPNDVNVVGVRKKLDTLVEKNAIAMQNSPSIGHSP